jgi:hypothetical protein
MVDHAPRRLQCTPSVHERSAKSPQRVCHILSHFNLALIRLRAVMLSIYTLRPNRNSQWVRSRHEVIDNKGRECGIISECS